MKKRLQAKIYGRVQGVFFRAFIFEKAQQLNLSGFVKNNPDGTLYFEAEGEEASLKKLLKLAKKGPIFAKVKKIEYQFLDDLKHFQKFEIVYH